MSEVNLTNATYHILCELYKIYLQRRKDGIPKFNAVYFSETKNIRNTYMPQVTKDNYHASIIELENAEYVELYTDGGFRIKNQAIIIMENRFKNSLSAVMEFISKIPLI